MARLQAAKSHKLQCPVHRLATDRRRARVVYAGEQKRVTSGQSPQYLSALSSVPTVF